MFGVREINEMKLFDKNLKSKGLSVSEGVKVWGAEPAAPAGGNVWRGGDRADVLRSRKSLEGTLRTAPCPPIGVKAGITNEPARQKAIGRVSGAR